VVEWRRRGGGGGEAGGRAGGDGKVAGGRRARIDRRPNGAAVRGATIIGTERAPQARCADDATLSGP